MRSYQVICVMVQFLKVDYFFITINFVGLPAIVVLMQPILLW